MDTGRTPKAFSLSRAFCFGLALRVFALLAVSGVLGALLQIARRDAIPWVGDWEHYIETKARGEHLRVADRETVREIMRTGSHLLIDARPLADYQAGHIEGALPLPADEPENQTDTMSILTPGDAVLIYCSGLECDESLMAARLLRDRGITNLTVYPGGWTEWSGP